MTCTCNRQGPSAHSRMAICGDKIRRDTFRPIGCAGQLSLMLAFVLLFTLSRVLIGMALASLR